MAIIRFEPAPQLDLLQNEMNRVFSSFFGDTNLRSTGGLQRWVPAMDLYEDGDQYVLKCDLPGLTESDVDIEYQDGMLTVSGERSQERENQQDGYYRHERSSGSFLRSLSLPDIDPDSIDASFEQGVLTVRVPKPEESKPRRIRIGRGERQTIEGSESR
jgi:HSP20 family protein